MGQLDAGLDNLKFEIQEDALLGTKIKVIGVGGGGSNAVARMIDEGVSGVEFHILNTDVQALNASSVPNKLAIGGKITNGLGAGSDPEVGRQAALEDTEKIIEILEGADMVFVTAGLGGGTGTGAAPVVASLAKGLNALTVAVVTKPFGFEGPRRIRQAEKGLAELGGTVDSVISIPNDRLLQLVPTGTSFVEAFRTADDVLRQAVQGISDIMTTPGIVNRDFSDIRAIMLGMGYAMMGTATAKGENAAVRAAEQAISCALLEEGGVKGARGVLINITGSSRLGIHEVNEACTLIRQATHNDDVQVNFGVVLNESMEDQVKITVIATGFERENLVQLDRHSATASTTVAPEPVPPPAPAIPSDPVTVYEEVYASAIQEAPVDTPPPVAEVEEVPPEPIPEPPQVVTSDELSLNDLDTPAYIRRERRLFQ